MTKREKHSAKAGKRIAIAVQVVPRAKKDEVVQILPERLVKIRLKAPPAEGKANQALIDLLARILDTPASEIDIVAGITSRKKLVLVTGMDAETAIRRLSESIASKE